MPKRRKTVDDECEALLQRAANSLSTRRTKHLEIYLRSLTQRLKELDYSLEELNSRLRATTESTGDSLSRQEKRDFYSSSLWAFAYSLFDILAHVVNVVYPIVSDESKVSFFGAVNGYNRLSAKVRTSESLPSKLTARLRKITNRQYFKRLRSYRQCCLHRRAVCVEETVTTTTVSLPYADTTSRQASCVNTVLCDDPNDMKPRFTKMRDLQRECETIRNTVREDVADALRLV